MMFTSLKAESMASQFNTKNSRSITFAHPLQTSTGHFDSSHAERKSGFMKWLSKLLKGGSSPGSVNGGNHQFIGDENMVLRASVRSLDNHTRSDKEKEELHRAIALSLAEGLKKPNGYVVATTMALVTVTTWVAWGHFFIQSAFVVVLVATQSLNMSSLYQGKRHTISSASKS